MKKATQAIMAMVMAFAAISSMQVPSSVNRLAVAKAAGETPAVSTKISTGTGVTTTVLYDDWYYEVTTLPEKLVYQVGEELDLTGMVASFVSEGPEDVNKQDVTEYVVASGFDSSQPGECVVTISHDLPAGGPWRNNTFTVTILADKEPVSTGPMWDDWYHEVTELPDKLVYQVGEELDLTGLVASYVYACPSGVTKKDVTDQVVATGFDSSKPGECEVTISFPTDSSWPWRNNTFTVTILGAVETLPTDVTTSTAPDVSTTTSYTTTLTWDMWYSELTQLPDKRVYLVGEELDLSGLVAGAYQAYGTYPSEDDKHVCLLKDLTDSIVASGFDSSVPGEYTITVASDQTFYSWLDPTFTVRVVRDSNVKGDANCDGVTSIADTVMLARYVAQDDNQVLRQTMQYGTKNTDLNGDTEINADDITRLSRLLANLSDNAQ